MMSWKVVDKAEVVSRALRELPLIGIRGIALQVPLAGGRRQEHMLVLGILGGEPGTVCVLDEGKGEPVGFFVWTAGGGKLSDDWDKRVDRLADLVSNFYCPGPGDWVLRFTDE